MSTQPNRQVYFIMLTGSNKVHISTVGFVQWIPEEARSQLKSEVILTLGEVPEEFPPSSAGSGGRFKIKWAGVRTSKYGLSKMYWTSIMCAAARGRMNIPCRGQGLLGLPMQGCPMRSHALQHGLSVL